MSDFRLGDLIQAIDENKEAMNVQLTGSNDEEVFRDAEVAAGEETVITGDRDGFTHLRMGATGSPSDVNGLEFYFSSADAVANLFSSTRSYVREEKIENLGERFGADNRSFSSKDIPLHGRVWGIKIKNTSSSTRKPNSITVTRLHDGNSDDSSEILKDMQDELESVKQNTARIAPGVSHQKYYVVTSNPNDDSGYIVNEDRACIIQSLTYRSNNDVRQLYFRLYELSSEMKDMIVIDGDTEDDFAAIRPRRMAEIGGETSLFKLTKNESGDYVIILKRPVYAPLGFRIRVIDDRDPEEEFSAAEFSVVYFDE